MSEPQSLTILGATGSIGTSTLDLVGRLPERFVLSSVTAGTNAKALAAIARRHGAQFAAVADPAAYEELKAQLSGSGIACGAGPAALVEAAERPADRVMAAIVGTAGLAPTLAALRRGTTVLLANKECLVSAGDCFMRTAREHEAEVLPVDSEHSAIFQALEGRNRDCVETATLTASGGPFRTASLERLEQVTAAEAVCHPNWSMGAKVSVDSATLMNKGLELIEAHHLFALSAEQLRVLVHPESVVHGLVSYTDGSVLAQLAPPDMRTPIALSLAWPARMTTPVPRLDLARLAKLTFEEPDLVRFPALAHALAALGAGGGAPTVLNAANEVAVAEFLVGRLRFLDIARIVGAVLDRAAASPLTAPAELDDALELDRWARMLTREAIARAPESA
ncbi:1-deoxy-D-xylulose-5-phosphate reductoisomerase [Lutibaculum baratangense]|uniref:1-deoxy-D-xylulose 5-phosphate reductoisomerase n=1 Tax=Lutibaculum baratangense AMV1 TaxID=631454 RepID=V4TAK9_9HYPH|nr:1-deoxy-D-xylulose-5-phosphate reductoisomerase [Lutibaculum baratangense]ESR23468.1 1-deoxy-D-xylulose 5-phosphate reductoisomerase [Lutibaculum baratangense AMV1]